VKISNIEKKPRL